MRWIFAFLLLISSGFSQDPDSLSFSFRDLNGNEGRFPILGKQVVLSFLNKGSSNVLEKWFDSLPYEDLESEQMVFVNIIFPGGIFFMIPKKKARNSLRTKVNQEISNYLSDCTELERRLYGSLDIRWIPDFKRKVFAQFGLKSSHSHFLLFSEAGTIQGIYEGFTQMQKMDFLSKLGAPRKRVPETGDRSQNKQSGE